MPPTQAQIGYGVQVYIGDGAGPEVFTKIGEVADATPPDSTLGTVEGTHMESPNSHKEWIAALRDTGEATVALNFLPTDPTQALLRTALKNRRRANFRFVLPGAVQRFEGPAFVTSISRAIPREDKMVLNVSLKAAAEWDQVAHP
jgi:predicted secreted protein